MSLPVINVPSFETILPSTKKKIKYRPFLIKEQKAMLIANESGEESAKKRTILDVIDSCTFGKLDIDSLPKFDIDYMFVKLRAKSVGESVELEIKCIECDEVNPYILKLDDIGVTYTEGHTKKIAISDSMGIILRYPSAAETDYLVENYSIENVFELLISCIDQIYEGDKVTLTKSIKREELIQWFEGLGSNCYDKFEEFFQTQPLVKTTMKFKCQKCEADNEYVVEGINNFFA